jgi:hypothetical protein
MEGESVPQYWGPGNPSLVLDFSDLNTIQPFVERSEQYNRDEEV